MSENTGMYECGSVWWWPRRIGAKFDIEFYRHISLFRPTSVLPDEYEPGFLKGGHTQSKFLCSHRELAR
jgi:hypothetical protein